MVVFTICYISKNVKGAGWGTTSWNIPFMSQPIPVIILLLTDGSTCHCKQILYCQAQFQLGISICNWTEVALLSFYVLWLPSLTRNSDMVWYGS